MRLKNVPPDSVLATLPSLGIDLQRILISIPSDINAAGEYGTQWLLAGAERLWIFDPDHPGPSFTFAFSEIESFRNSPAVGSGILQLRIAGVWLDILRFTNRQKYDFDRALKRLEQIRRGETPAPEELDEQDPQRCSRCGLMLEFPGELCPRCIRHGAALGRMMGMIRPYWKEASVMMLLLVIGIALDMAWPLLTRYLVDYVLTRPSPGSTHPIAFLAHLSPYTQLIYIVLALAAVHVVHAGTTMLSGRIAGKVGNAVTFDIRARLLQKLEQLGLAYYSKQDTGSLVGRVAYDTEAIQSLMTQITSGFFMQFLLVIVSFIMMASMDLHLALWALVPAPAVLAGAFVYWRYVHPHFQRFWDRTSKQASVLNGILSGIRVVKAFAQEENEYLRFQRYSDQVRNTKNTLDVTSALFYPVMAIVFQVGGWIIWYVGGRNVLEHTVSLGTLMAFFGYLSMFYGPLGSLTNLTTWMTQFSTQTYRIFEILDTPSALPEPERPVVSTAIRGEIEFRNVTFGYTRGSPIIRDFDLRIAPGERLGIVGRSGSGKTSLINLICRFYDVDAGQILFDGIDLRNLSKDDLRSRISIVLQEPFLFRGTLVENIRYGKPDASPEEVIRAARAASAHDFTMQHSLAYDTPVGERGYELSGGERQRISIARALLVSPPILILDEATSSVDTESELSIQTALDQIARDRTMIIVAHRLSTLQSCDRIIVIEGGRIVEEGSHRELMMIDGLYASWVRIQQGQSYIEMSTPEESASRRRNFAPASPGSLPPLQSFLPRWLRPDTDLFDRGPRRELQLEIPGESAYRGVFALRCFPVHFPEGFISLRHVNEENRIEEIGLIQDLSEWPVFSQNLVRESLGRRYFFHMIERIRSIRRVSQFLSIRAATDLGNVEFTLRNTPDSVQDYGQHGRMLIDVEGNLYLVEDVSKLSRSEREDFERYIYW